MSQVSLSPPPVTLPGPTLPGPSTSTSGRKQPRSPSNERTDPCMPELHRSRHRKVQMCKGDVHLLDKKASGSAAASDFETQWTFNRLLGITDTEVKLPEGGNFTRPIEDDDVEILATANCHTYCEELEEFPHADELYVGARLGAILQKRNQGLVGQCDCKAHLRLLEEG